MEQGDIFTAETIRRIRTYGWQERAAITVEAWREHLETCGQCFYTQHTHGADYHLCPSADALLSATFLASTQAAIARAPQDDGEEPAAFAGQPWLAPVEVA